MEPEKKSRGGFLRPLVLLPAAAIAVLMLQSVYFASVLGAQNTDAPTDVVLIFRGTEMRIEF